MMRALWTASSGRKQQFNVDVISNNLQMLTQQDTKRTELSLRICCMKL